MRKKFLQKLWLLAILCMVGVTSANAAPGDEVTTIANIVDGKTYYIKGVRSSNAYYLKFSDEIGNQSGTESSTIGEAIAITFVKTGENVYNLVTPSNNYIAPGTANGRITVSNTSIDVTASNVSSNIRLSITSGTETWSIEKNTSSANFGGYKNTQNDITLIEAAAPVAYAVTLGDDKTILTETSAGAGVLLPVRTAYTGYTFVGWSKTNCSIETDVKPEIINTGTYHPDGDVTLYPIFYRVDDDAVSYNLVTDVLDLAENDILVFVGKNKIDAVTSYYAMKAYESGNNFKGTSAFTITGDSFTELPEGAAELTLTGNSSGWYFYDGSKYVYADGSEKKGGGYNNYMKGKATKDDACKFTISITTGDATITSNSNTSTPYARFNYNNGTTLFACYNQNTGGSAAINIYKKSKKKYYISTITVTIPNDGFATYCFPFDVTVPDGVKVITALCDGELVVTSTTDAEKIKAGEGVILKNVDNSKAPFVFAMTTDAESLSSENDLKGCTSDYTLLSGNDYYVLVAGTPYKFKKYTGTYIPANKAFFELAKSPAKELIIEWGDATGINKVDNSECTMQNSQLYNLQGVRVNDSYKGIVISNGKKYILK